MRSAHVVCLVVLGVVCLLSNGCRAAPEAAAPTSSTPPTPTAFIYYATPLPGGGSEAFLYWQGGAPEKVATAALGALPFDLRLLPASGEVLEASRAIELPPTVQPLYVDWASGKVVHPDPAWDVEANPRRVLIEAAGDRAVVLEFSIAKSYLATLYLYRGAALVTLGEVTVNDLRHSLARDTLLFLDADREHLTWTGPAGAFEADLTTGQVTQVTPQEAGPPTPPAEPWPKDLRAVSPGGTYHLLMDKNAPAAPKMRLVVAPGKEPSDEEMVAQGGWAIDGKDASCWVGVGDPLSYYRLRLGGAERFAVGKPVITMRTLSLAEGGRLLLGLGARPIVDGKIPSEWDRAWPCEVRVVDFGGKQVCSAGALHAYAYWAGPLQKWEALWVLDRRGEEGVLQRVDYMNGKVEEVLRGRHLRVFDWGETLVAAAGHDDDNPQGAAARFDVYVAEDQGRQWRKLESGVSQLRLTASSGEVGFPVALGYVPPRLLG